MMRKNTFLTALLMLMSVLGLKAQMVLEYNTNLSAGTTITLPLQGTVSVTVDWGDGTATEDFTTAGNQDYTYAADGEYTVSITGSLTQFGENYPNAGNSGDTDPSFRSY